VAIRTAALAKFNMKKILMHCSTTHLAAVHPTAFPLHLIPQFTLTDVSQITLPEQSDQTAFL
jgi:hypothetical protein